jgi:translation initiation factor IF-2
MRARGTQVTDIAVLVVAADDGVMPQTREAIRHARAARCALVIALTKCDRANAQPERVEADLAAEGLEFESVGGNVSVVQTAAPVGMGLRELEEAILLQAELLEIAAPVEGRAEGTVVEAHMEKGVGPVATVVVREGTLRVGDPVVVGKEHGRVRQLRKTNGVEVEEATPGARRVCAACLSASQHHLKALQLGRSFDRLAST